MTTGSSSWSDFDAFAKAVADAYSTPDAIFASYCGSLSILKSSTRIPKDVRDYAGVLHDTIRSSKRVQSFEQARLAIATLHDNAKTTAAEGLTTNSLKRAAYEAIAVLGDEYVGSVKHARTSINLENPAAENTNYPEEYLSENAELSDTDELEVVWEPEAPFVNKLRKILKDCSKSTKSSFDKELAKNGILRLSSRKEDEPSTMKNVVKKKLTVEERTSLKALLRVPGVDVLDSSKDLLAKTLPEMRSKLDNCGPPTSEQNRAVRSIYNLFVSGLEGKADLTDPMMERTWTAKYIVPLFEWCLHTVHYLKSFWCEKGDVDIIKSREKEHHLWDGAFLDADESQKPHVLLIEVSGGTEGASKKKVDSDLLKLAKGMKRHFVRVGRSVRGIDVTSCRRLRVAGVQVIANVMHFQAITIVGQDVFVMWEWSRKKIPRSVEDMWGLASTLASMYTLKAMLLETKSIIAEARYIESQTYEVDHSSGLSSPTRETDTPWESCFE